MVGWEDVAQQTNFSYVVQLTVFSRNDACKDYFHSYLVHAEFDGKPSLSFSGNDVLGKANISE